MADTTTPHPYESYHEATKAMQSIEQGREPRTAKASLDLLENTVKYLRANADPNGILNTTDETKAKAFNDIGVINLMFSYLLPSAKQETRDDFIKTEDGKKFLNEVVLQSHFGIKRKDLDKALVGMKTLSGLTLSDYLGNFNGPMLQKSKDSIVDGLKLESDEDIKTFNAYVKKIVADNKGAVQGILDQFEAKGVTLRFPNDKTDPAIWSKIVTKLPDDYIPAELNRPTV